MSTKSRTRIKEPAVTTEATDSQAQHSLAGELPVPRTDLEDTEHADAGAAPHAPRDAATVAPVAPARRRINLGLDRFSGLYVWVGVIVIFAIWIPKLFLTVSNVHIVAGDQAITAMIALALILPLAAGVFDLSIAANMGFGACVTAWMLGHNGNPLLAALAAVVACTIVGTLNGIVVVKLHVNSFIATLGMSSVLAAGSYYVTNGEQLIKGFSNNFLDLGNKPILGFPLPFWIMLVLALVLYVIVEFSTTGRSLYATGGNPQAARLAGVRVDRIVFGTLVASGFIAGIVGVVLASRLSSGSYTVGPPYLLPAFSAVFLGSTQIKAGRVNVIGTLVAIYLLATGVKGLQLATSAAWVNDLFNGLALIIAVALAARTSRRR